MWMLMKALNSMEATVLINIYKDKLLHSMVCMATTLHSQSILTQH